MSQYQPAEIREMLLKLFFQWALEDRERAKIDKGDETPEQGGVSHDKETKPQQRDPKQRESQQRHPLQREQPESQEQRNR
ncbi:hypothetical protein [Heliobacterium mobile]|uniref:hypothetical protein n=1 Tax=Heliobacterium mobile TaxID=28064 RepID=UPI00147856BF|nr:hypothetical protein [Heliobacterium mobile]